MAAPQQYSGKGFILGGVTDDTPDWLGSYNEGVQGAQQQTQNRLNQQESKQRMAQNAAAEARRATEFDWQSQDRARTEAAWTDQQGLPGLQTPQGPALGPMDPMVLPAPIAPSPGLMEDATPAAPGNNGAITREQFIQLLPEWARIEQAEGLPPNYLETISMLESSGGTNTGSGNKYTGIFQVGPEVAADFGVTPEQLRDPRINAQVAAKLAARNAKLLRARLNREPQPWELYLAHQQGAGGATLLLQNPDRNAVDVLTAAYSNDRTRAQQAVIQNGGDPRMTAGEFAQLWASKFGGARPQPFTGQPGVQTDGQVPFTRDPNRSDLANDFGAASAQTDADFAIGTIIKSLTDFSGGGGRTNAFQQGLAYAFGESGEAGNMMAANEQAEAARSWYMSFDTQAWLRSNPQLIAQAQSDPIAVYNQYKDQVAPAAPEAAKGDLPAGVQETMPAAPAPAPAAPAPTPEPGIAPPASDEAFVTAAQSIGTDIVPAVSNADFAGVTAPGIGTIAQQIMRAPPGQQAALPDSGLYIAEPAKISADLNELMTARQMLERRYNDAMRFRDRQTMLDIESKVIEVDAATRLLQNMQSIAALEGGDTNQISQTLSRLTGGQTRIQEVQPGGTFNIYQNGQLAYQNVPKQALIASLRSQFDQQYQQMISARAKQADAIEMEQVKQAGQTNMEVVKRQADTYKELAIKRAEQQYNSDPRNAEYSASTQTGPDGSPILFLTPKRGGLPPQIWQLVPDLGVDGQPLAGPDGNPKLSWKQQSTGGNNTVPVQ
ncbi:MAG: transglycosylase SLT domain-containing protein [Armatimonadia bacterium]